MTYSIVIPNWNGEKLIRRNLPAVLATGANEVIVVDNGSTDGSVIFLEKLQRSNKTIRIIKLDNNYGFAYACNLGVSKAKGEIVVLLNNDVIPERSCLKVLDGDFDDMKVFAVSLGETEWSWAKGMWKSGFIEHEPGKRTDKVHISFWASGGSAAFRRKTWITLGGFDNIYAPFYWEDTDLSYRAWKRGYKVVWNPKSVVRHQHESTVKANFTKKYIGLIIQRNQLIFIWKNITDKKMMLEHMKGLLVRLMRNPAYIKPIILALIKLPAIITRRQKEARGQTTTDQTIFAQFNRLK